MKKVELSVKPFSFFQYGVQAERHLLHRLELVKKSAIALQVNYKRGNFVRTVLVITTKCTDFFHPHKNHHNNLIVASTYPKQNKEGWLEQGLLYLSNQVRSHRLIVAAGSPDHHSYDWSQAAHMSHCHNVTIYDICHKVTIYNICHIEGSKKDYQSTLKSI